MVETVVLSKYLRNGQPICVHRSSARRIQGNAATPRIYRRCRPDQMFNGRTSDVRGVTEGPSRIKVSLHAVLPQSSIERGATDPKFMSGSAQIALRKRERFHDQVGLDPLLVDFKRNRAFILSRNLVRNV